MGYDMYTVDEDGHNVRGCTEPSHGEHYWHRSIFGGHPQAQRLVEAGVGYWSQPPAGQQKWPTVQGAEYGDYDEDLDHCLPLNPAAREEIQLQTAYIRATWDERPGIAVYKLCSSNDGWWVTKAECESALKLWEQAGKPKLDDDYGDTVPFLIAGAAHSGFRVW